MENAVEDIMVSVLADAPKGAPIAQLVEEEVEARGLAFAEALASAYAEVEVGHYRLESLPLQLEPVFNKCALILLS